MGNMHITGLQIFVSMTEDRFMEGEVELCQEVLVDAKLLIS